MAYGAYQLAQPRQSLLDSMVTRSLGPGVDPSIKKKSIMEDFKEQMGRKSKSAQKRSKKWQPVTQALDFAAGFVDPATAAIMGAVSGGLSGYDKMRAYEGIKDAGKEFEGYNFMDEMLKSSQDQISGMETDAGDVLVSAGTQALKNFAMGEASKAIGGASKGAPKALDPLADTTEAFETAGQTALESTGKMGGEVGQKFAMPKPEAGLDMSKLEAGKTFGMKPPKLDPSAFKFEPKPLPGTTSGIDPAFADTAIEAGGKGVSGFKPEGADWIKKLQEGGGEDMLKNLFGSGASSADIMANLSAMTQMGMNFASPFLNKDKVSRGFDLGY